MRFRPLAPALACLFVLAACESDPPPGAPVLERIAPGAFPANRDTPLRITGRHLVASTRVTFDGTVLVTSEVAPNTLAATIPARLIEAPRLARLVATNGASSDEADLRVFAEQPTLTRFEPEAIEVGRPTTVAIVGAGFLPMTKGYFRGAPLSLRYVSYSRVEFDLRAEHVAVPGLAPITLSNGDAALSTRADLQIRAPAPTLAPLPATTLAMLPISDEQSTPTELAVTGTHFYESTQAEVTEGPARCAFVHESATSGKLHCAPGTLPAEAVGKAFAVRLSNTGRGAHSDARALTWEYPKARLSARSTHAPSGTAILLDAVHAHPDAVLKADGRALGVGEVTRTGDWTARFEVTLASFTSAVAFTLENPAPGGGASEPVTVAPLAGTDLGPAKSLLLGASAGGRAWSGRALLERTDGTTVLVEPDASTTDLGVVTLAIERTPDDAWAFVHHAAGVVLVPLAGGAVTRVATQAEPTAILRAADGTAIVVVAPGELVRVELATATQVRVADSRAPRTLVAGVLDHPRRLVVAASHSDAARIDFSTGEITPLTGLQDTPAGLLADGTTVVEPRRVLLAPPLALPGRALAASVDGTWLLTAPTGESILRVNLATRVADEAGPRVFGWDVAAVAAPGGVLVRSTYFRRADGALLSWRGTSPAISADGRWLASAIGGSVAVLELPTGEERTSPGHRPTFAGSTLVYARSDAGRTVLVTVAPEALGTLGQAAAEAVIDAVLPTDVAVAAPGGSRLLVRGWGPGAQWSFLEPATGRVLARLAPGTEAAALTADTLLSIEGGRAVAWSP